MTVQRNVYGRPLVACSTQNRAGFTRTGFCETGAQDPGMHGVCAVVTREFLAFTASRGNDLVSPRPDFDFPGLAPGDRWCLCAGRWEEARKAGCAPPVVLEATHEEVLRHLALEDLERHAPPSFACLSLRFPSVAPAGPRPKGPGIS